MSERTLVEDPLVVHTKDGKFLSNRLICPCGSGVFRIFRHEGQNHGHFMCVHCDAIWCGTFDNSKCDHSEMVPANKQ